MNENAKLWVQTLRSGRYEQGRGQLRTRDEFCCLGVACDLFCEETGEGEWVGNLGRSFRLNGRDEFLALPPRVAKWLGLRDIHGEFLDGALTILNDERRCTFEQIASVIESEPEGLFR